MLTFIWHPYILTGIDLYIFVSISYSQKRDNILGYGQDELLLRMNYADISATSGMKLAPPFW